MTIGDKIKQLRLERKMTQDDLAQKLYVSRNAISKWENNKGTPSIDNIQSIATMFNISIDELINESKSVLWISYHTGFVIGLSIITFIIYGIQSSVYSYSMTLFITIQLGIYVLSSISLILISGPQIRYSNLLLNLYKPILISLGVQAVIGLILEL